MGEVPAAVRQGPRPARRGRGLQEVPRQPPVAPAVERGGRGRFTTVAPAVTNSVVRRRGTMEPRPDRARCGRRRRLATVLAAGLAVLGSAVVAAPADARSSVVTTAPPLLRDAAGLHVTAVNRVDDRTIDA